MLLLFIATILLPNVAMAKIFIVGNQSGWTVGFDYQVRTADKTFIVGDILGN